jgi:PAS domain S-box-containing protein
VIECDCHFNIVNWNNAACHLLGYQIDEVRGQNLAELFFPPERLENLPVFLAKLFQDDRATIIDMPLVNRSLQRIPLRFYVTPIFADDRTPVQIAMIVVENYAETKQHPFPGVIGTIHQGIRRHA